MTEPKTVPRRPSKPPTVAPNTSSPQESDAGGVDQRTLLEEISITGLGVIDAATIPLGPGLTVLTGETGAGKTMVVTSLDLLCGGKADAARVRTGANQALVQGRVRLGADSPLREVAADAGVDLDEQCLLLARTITAAGGSVGQAGQPSQAGAQADQPGQAEQQAPTTPAAKTPGRSRAYAGSRSVPAAWLGQVAQDLVAVHGQSDQQRLLKPSQQRQALDRFAGEPVAALLAEYRQAYQELARAQQELEQLSTQARERAREADLLRDGVARIEAVNPQPGELEQLEAEANRLTHADQLHAATATAHALLAGADVGEGTDAVAALAQAAKELANASAHDQQLAHFSHRVEQASYQVADVAAELAAYSTAVETDPVRLDAIGERREELAGLTRRYADTIEQVLQWAQDSRERLAQLEGDADHTQHLQQQVAHWSKRRQECATTLHQARAEAARELSKQVSTELTSLALPHAQLQVQVNAGEFGPWGADEVLLLLAPNPGSPPLPLHQGASGGELSRVMLALEVVLAGRDPVPVFVFDEVDAGVGGKAALEVGRRLAALARHAQVLVVTHLPQVACFADAHLSVVKSSDGSITRSGVVVLDRAARETEIARMLAGAQDSATARAHAAELLDQAATPG